MRAAADQGRHRRARPGGPPRAAVRVRHPLDAARARPRHAPRAGSPRCSARCRWSPGSSARTLRDEYARRLAGWASWDDIAMVVRRVRETAGAPVEPARRPQRRPRAPRRRPKDDPRLHVQREALKAALQVPAHRRAELRRAARAGVHPPRATPRCTGRCRRRAGSCGGLCRPAVAGGRRWPSAPPDARAAGHRAGRRAAGAAAAQQRRIDEARYVASIIAGVRLALVEAQVAELKSRLQRTNPVEDPDAYHAAVRRPRAAGAVQDRAAASQAAR